MKPLAAPVLTLLVLQGCAGNAPQHTLAELRGVEPDLAEVPVGDSLDRALEGYRRFLEETPTSGKTPEALRRLADLQLERRYGILGGTPAGATAPAPASPRSAPGAEALVPATPTPYPPAAPSTRSTMPATPAAATGETALAAPALPAPDAAAAADASPASRVENIAIADLSEDQAAFEARATKLQPTPIAGDLSVGETETDPGQAIATYTRILEEYPNYERNDQVLYQMARAYDELGQPDEAMAVMDRFVREFGNSEYADEVHFRRAEYYFVRRMFLDAEEAYGAVIAMGGHSDFYELALYKLGWSLYKQELYEDALHRYVALLDYKVSVGYDFDQIRAAGEWEQPESTSQQAGGDNSEQDERRVADTFRVISLAFSNLGGPEVLNEYFRDNGHRTYEDRIYSNLGEFYLSKLRYNDAAIVYESFTELNPFHRVAPVFGMRVVEIYEDGGFAQLVVEAKQDYARRYALDAEYWLHFPIEEAPEVMAYLQTNLRDLANHFHSLYQDEGFADEQPENYAQALHWYGQYLDSFPEHDETPQIHYQLADLLFENEDFDGAARAYERTAYDYPAHEQSAAAGYAAIYAHRQFLDVVPESGAADARLDTVESSLRFADTFADHEHAPTVLGAAADDLYAMGDHLRAIDAGTALIERYPASEIALRRAAWTVVAHASMDLERYADAEAGYGEVLTLTGEDDEGRPALYDNLAAAIYKQGEVARAQEDHLAAAEHFLRIGYLAPASTIRPAAEYDAATSLMKLEDWPRAADVFRGFRENHPGHELQPEVTKQLAYVYREAGDLSQSATEYVRVADGAGDSQIKRESLLMAGDLFDEADDDGQALEVFSRYVEEYPEPVDLALEIRFRIAGLHEDAGARDRYHAELQRIVDIDAGAGDNRTARTRFLAGKSALVLAELDFAHFEQYALTLPFEASLAEKQARMDGALASFEHLVDYGIAEVTTAATYYMAEIYRSFGAALLGSERPTGLDAAESAEYELAIEGEAFPFEERAIEVHEKNVELMLAGTYDGWVRRSLDQLASMMPGRYAKAEISSGFIGPVEVFAYRAPGTELNLSEDSEVSQGPASDDDADRGEQNGGILDVSAVL